MTEHRPFWFRSSYWYSIWLKRSLCLSRFERLIDKPPLQYEVMNIHVVTDIKTFMRLYNKIYLTTQTLRLRKLCIQKVSLNIHLCNCQVSGILSACANSLYQAHFTSCLISCWECVALVRCNLFYLLIIFYWWEDIPNSGNFCQCKLLRKCHHRLQR